MSIYMALKWIEERNGSVQVEGGRYGTKVQMRVEINGKVFERTEEFTGSQAAWSASIEVCFRKLKAMIEKDAT